MALRALGEQLNLDVGGSLRPAGSSFRVSGKLAVDDQLLRGDEVLVTITNADGEIVVAGHGYVKGIGFLTHRPADAPEWVERVHTIKLG